MADKYRTDLSREYFFEEGCYITEVMNDPDHSDVSIARARLPVGQSTRLHLLKNTSETYHILSGQGNATIGGKVYKLTEGDNLYIPPEQLQKIKNIGDEDLVFLCICHPRFTPDNYVDMEDQVDE